VESQEKKGTTFVITLRNLIRSETIKESLIKGDSQNKQLIEVTT